MDKKEKLFAYLAGACGVILAVHNIALIIQIEENATFSSIEYVIEICLLSAALFLRNKTVVLAAAGLSVISDVYYLIAYFSVFNLLSLLANLLFVAIIFSVVVVVALVVVVVVVVVVSAVVTVVCCGSTFTVTSFV